jgi:AraC-like DNA-binding protein
MSRKAKNREFDFQLDEHSLIGRRNAGFLSDGSYFFEDELQIEGFLTAKVFTAAAWLLELYKLSAGDFFFTNDLGEIRPETSSFGVLYAPFTISQPCFRKARVHVVGIAATTQLPREFLNHPVLFDTEFAGTPSAVNEVIDILRSVKNFQAVESTSKPSLLSLKAKKLIDANYLAYPAIARIAERLKVSHEHLSRQFKLDFGLSPSSYLHKLRLADAPLRLARGEQIVNVSLDAGYNDLSRFYKQFRKNTKTSPGACQTLLRPSAK